MKENKKTIVLKRLEQPVHVSESEYGLLLERDEFGYRLVRETAYAKSGGTTEYSLRSWHLDNSFIKRLSMQSLAKKIMQLTGLGWSYSVCPDKTALIELFGKTRCY